MIVISLRSLKIIWIIKLIEILKNSKNYLIKVKIFLILEELNKRLNNS